MTNSFDALASKIRPEVWQLYGDALNLVGGQMGKLGDIAIKTGSYLDRLAAKIVVFISSPGFQQGLTTLIKAGIAVLQQLGDIFKTWARIWSEFAKVAQTTHIAEDLLSILDAGAQAARPDSEAAHPDARGGGRACTACTVGRAAGHRRSSRCWARCVRWPWASAG